MVNVNINTEKKHRISPILYGVFFEDINYAGDGGLYGELIPNRSFEYYDREGKCDKHKMCWEAVGEASFEIKTEKPINRVHTHYACVSGTAESGIRNRGYCKKGFAVKNGDVFDFTCYTSSDKPTKFAVRICGRGGIFGQIEIDVNSTQWQKHERKINISGNCKNAYIELLLTEKSSVNLDFISLFNSDTFCGRKNGLRRDIAQLIAELSPKFMRFPGGCIVEGRSFENMYNWKETIGAVEERRTNWNRWQMPDYQPPDKNSDDYFQSYGLGYFEYFQFCEDIGAKPVPVMNVGMTCQWHEALLIDTDKLDPWIDDILDLIEFANGNTDTKWGAKRAEMGHPEPFNLEYIGVGNEQWGNEYFERYEIFQKKISEKYPDIKLITSAGWSDAGKEFDLAMEWMKSNKDKAYAVDEHFYKSPEWFLENIDRYDNYDRTLPKVFAGEYAAHTDTDVTKRQNNWYAALCEAAFLTGVEKNSDHVVMTCYAPLLAKTDCQQWQPDLIWFDNEGVYGTPSYYVQKLFSENADGYSIDITSDDENVKMCANISEDGAELIIKAVNLADIEKTLCMNIKDVKRCRVMELFAEVDAVNSHENPLNVCPVEADIDYFDKYTVKANSVTVFKFEIA